MSTRRRIEENPFYVLGVSTSCTRMEVEREGHKLLSMMELSLSGADTYYTPFGARPRTPELVREAMAALRDPQRRLTCELWARLGTGAVPEQTAPQADPGDEPEPWADAMAALGWSPKP